jgi:Mrp family chromosome partitioning ATPase
MTHLWVVVLSTLVAVAAAVLALSARPLTYAATAEVVLSPIHSPHANPVQPDMGTERAVAESGVVVLAAANDLGVDPSTVRHDLAVAVPLQSFVLRMSYHSTTPLGATRGASAAARAYVAYRNGQGNGKIATLVTLPSTPKYGSRGSLPIFVVLGLVAGLSVGVAAAWMLDRFSDRVRSSAELNKLSGLPILTRLRRWKRADGLLPPAGPAREPFAFAAARLTSMTGHGSGKTIVVTSPHHGAGTTSVACGVASALAGQGKHVVLLAASHGRLKAEQVLGARVSDELAQLMSLGCSEELALHPTSVRNLSVVPLGASSGVRLELEDVHLVLERLERQAFVVVDAPPVLASADSLLLVDAADLVLLVGDLRTGTRGDVRETLARLDDVGPRLAGWVTNEPPRRWRRTPAAESVPPVADQAPAADHERGVLQLLTSTAGAEAREDEGASRPTRPLQEVRPQPGTKLLGTPRTVTAPRDDVRPVRGRGASARPR